MILDRAHVRNLGVDIAKTRHIYVHVDDVGVLSACPKVADALRDELREGNLQAGFGATIENAFHEKRYIGLRAHSSPACWYPDPVKLGHLDRLLDFLASRTSEEQVGAYGF